jgi:hypothetical protein
VSGATSVVTATPAPSVSAVSATPASAATAAPIIKLGPTVLSSGVINVVPASTSAGGVMTVAFKPLVPSVLPSGAGVTSLAAQNLANTLTAPANTLSTVDQLYKSFPHLRDKLEAQLAKMPVERREWFLRNQAAILAKLQQHQLMLQQQQKSTGPVVAASSGTLMAAAAGQPVTTSSATLSGIKLPVVRPSLSVATTVVIDGTTLTLPARVLTSPALRGTRKQRFQLQLAKEQKHATEPDYKTPFNGRKDFLRRLAVFHVFQTRDDDAELIRQADEAYEDQARQLLERKDSMLAKYRQLLLHEAMRLDSAANDVMLGRMFLNDERLLLKEERQLAAEDPDAFIPRPILHPTKSDPVDPDVDVKPSPVDDVMNIVELSDFKPAEPKKESCSNSSDRDNSDGASLSTNSSYTVHPSGRLTFVFKSSPHHVARSPSHSPPPTTDATAKPPSTSSADLVRDVRVKLERCDDQELTSLASPKRCRLDVDSGSPHELILQSAEDSTAGSKPLSEDDVAVASLLGSAHNYDSEMTATNSDGRLPFGYDDQTSEFVSAPFNGIEYGNSDDFFAEGVGEQVDYVAADGFGNGASISVDCMSEDIDVDLSAGQTSSLELFVESEDYDSSEQVEEVAPITNTNLYRFSSSQMSASSKLDDYARGLLNGSLPAELGGAHLCEGVDAVEEDSSLQQEMQFAIDSILSLQQQLDGSSSPQQLIDSRNLAQSGSTVRSKGSTASHGTGTGSEPDLDAAIRSILF